MGLVLTMMNTKGGVGKTTLALLIAGEIAHRGGEVLVIDTDERQNVARWAEITPESSRPGIAVIGETEPERLQILLEAEAEAGWRRNVLIDTQGADAASNIIAAATAHCVIVPAKMGGQDIASAITTVTRTLPIVEEHAGRRIPHLIIFNEVDLIQDRAALFKDTREFFEEQGARLARIRIWKRKPLYEMTTVGGTIRSLAGHPIYAGTKSAALAAAIETGVALVDEILGHVANSTEAGQ